MRWSITLLRCVRRKSVLRDPIDSCQTMRVVEIIFRAKTAHNAIALWYYSVINLVLNTSVLSTHFARYKLTQRKQLTENNRN